jgi:hypothetical protein
MIEEFYSIQILSKTTRKAVMVYNGAFFSMISFCVIVTIIVSGSFFYFSEENRIVKESRNRI